MSKLNTGVPGLISLEWEKCPDGYTVETLLGPEIIRWEIEKCDDGTDRWKILEYLTDDAPVWLREAHEDLGKKSYFFEEEAQARGLADQWAEFPTYQKGDQFIIPRSTRTISHRVIEDSPGAFMEFADCVESPDNTARFVSLYGYPHKPEDLGYWNWDGGDIRISNTQIVNFAWFEELAVNMRDAIDMWERAKKTGDYRKLKIMFEQAVFMDVEDFDYDNIEPNEPLTQLDIGLRLPSARHTSPTLSILPPNLDTALWLQLAIAVTDAPEIRRCEECPTWFEITPGKGRPEKKYCSNACSMRASRKRIKKTKKKVRKLRAGGMSIKRIAKEVGVPVDTVDRYLEETA